MPWQLVPGDDGFEWSLNMARAICALLMLFPLFFLACVGAIIMVRNTSNFQPVLLAVFAVLAIVITPAAPIVRDRVALAGIAVHRDDPRSHRRVLPVYSTFAAATIAGFLVAQAPAFFGFVASAVMRDLVPLGLGSAASYVAWAVLWPRRTMWSKWTAFAGIGAPVAEGEAASPLGAAANTGASEGATS